MVSDGSPAGRGKLGGRARAAALAPGERAAIAAAGARAANAPAALARRIVKAWPVLAADERDEVRAILRGAGIID
ncbi:hypothetical protein [Dactylosporangium sp. NPDC005555]|uniref:hypothetical protein n=1 Tax=Dactylosporangium sp. NPDC005555 TaxID=3154889 RepID=UPI0033A2EEAE